MRRRYYRRPTLVLAIIVLIVIAIIVAGIKKWITLIQNGDPLGIGLLVTAIVIITAVIVGGILYTKKRNDRFKQENNQINNPEGNNQRNYQEEKNTTINTYEEEEETQKYSAKSSMTEYENAIWKRLNSLFGEKYIVTPQVPLNSIVRKNIDNYYANDLYRTIDFGLFTKDNYEIVALIEINDKTHLQKNRMARDYKVKEILECAGLRDKLITLWTDKPNTDEYILNRVENILKIDE